MKLFELSFPSLFKLWSFRSLVKARAEKTSLLDRRLRCFCTDDEILLAIHAYSAKVRPA